MPFSPKIIYTFLLMLCATAVLAYAVERVSYIEDALLPAQQSAYPWRIFASSDAGLGGGSLVDLREDTYSLIVDFTLSSKLEYPFIALGLSFDSVAKPNALLDWAYYSSATLRVKCRPDNVLSFVLHTYEENLTKFSDISTFRPSVAFFNCSENWQEIAIDLQKMDTPEWWLRQQNMTLANQEYALDKVRGISIASSVQTPVDVSSSVAVEEVILKGRNWPVVYSAVALILLFWGGLVSWYMRLGSTVPGSPLEAQDAKEVRPPEPAEPTYQKLALESKRERERSAVLDYLAVEYTNPDLSVEVAVAALGINRAKINDVLRDEVGLTFSAYLNKLRLTEAARLLSEKQVGVAETAYAVGYGNVSYFNRVFKKAYGCTPSIYKKPEE